MTLRWNAHRLTAATLRDKILELGARAASIEHLDLGQNELESLPAELGEFRALKRLNVQQNTLVLLPDTFSFPRLEHLNASFNQIHQWPSWVVQCPKLMRLALAHNALRVPVPPVPWTDLARLEFLSLEGNPLPSTLAKFFDGKVVTQAALHLLEEHDTERFRDVPIAIAKKQ